MCIGYLFGEQLDIYHIWADKADGITVADWITNMRRFLDKLVDDDTMVSYRITRMKLGFRSIDALPEWHIMMEFNDLAQLDKAFKLVAPLDGDLEESHSGFNKWATNVQHALYRDYPDAT